MILPTQLPKSLKFIVEDDWVFDSGTTLSCDNSISELSHESDENGPYICITENNIPYVKIELSKDQFNAYPALVNYCIENNLLTEDADV